MNYDTSNVRVIETRLQFDVMFTSSDGFFFFFLYYQPCNSHSQQQKQAAVLAQQHDPLLWEDFNGLSRLGSN